MQQHNIISAWLGRNYFNHNLNWKVYNKQPKALSYKYPDILAYDNCDQIILVYSNLPIPSKELLICSASPHITNHEYTL